MADDGWEPGIYEEELDETDYAQLRREGRNYINESFILDARNSADAGQHARFVRKVFDHDSETLVEIETDRYLIRESDGGRIQIQLLVARQADRIKELWIQRVPRPGSSTPISQLVNFKRKDAETLARLLKALEFVPIEGDRIRSLDDELIKDLLADPSSVAEAYRRGRFQIEAAIATDADARDVVAWAHRRKQVGIFGRLLREPDYFAECKERLRVKGDEAVWQRFFEANPWIFGLGLTGQLITRWDNEKLEQTVAGHSIAGAGKKVDAMMRTSGRIKSMIFIEIKLPGAPLLHRSSTRSGCWGASRDLADGVAQLQGTAYRAVKEIGERINSRFPDGSEDLADPTYLFRPRCFLLIGELRSLLGEEGGHLVDKNLSFEMFRRSVTDLEVITFDELLARAEALVEVESEPGLD